MPEEGRENSDTRYMTDAEFVTGIRKIFEACRDLSRLAGSIRPFTPDGRMVGDIGEIIAGSFYQVKLDEKNRRNWDGTYNSRNVQIKTTQRNDTYLKEPPKDGFGDGLLMVFKIDPNSGSYKPVYNGEIQRVWGALDNVHIDRTGAKMISLDRLERLQSSVPAESIIPRVSVSSKSTPTETPR